MVSVHGKKACALAAISLAALSVQCAGAQSSSAMSSARSAPTSAANISRTLLDHYDLPEMPGWESRLYLVEYGPGVAAPVHHHPVRGSGYVISGSFESAFGNEPVTLTHAGQSFEERANQTHTVFRNPDPVNSLTFVMSFVVRSGEPVVVTP